MSAKRALFIRLDRMGDLVLTLPCDQLVGDTHDVFWVTPRGLEFVVDNCQPSKKYQSISPKGGWQEFKAFFQYVRTCKPDVSVTFHVPWWIHLALWLARVPVRAGVLSQWHSYLFLNRGLRQKRSRCEHHEMDYNYLLVEHAFSLTARPELRAPLKMVAPEQSSNRIPDAPYFVVHPGMGGSALNWSTEQYVQLIDQLSRKALVVITGTQNDEKYLAPIRSQLTGNTKVVWLDKLLKGPELLLLLSHSIANIAPSTGVLHLSASLGANSLGIFSPIQVHQAKRWGPRGQKTQTFSPDVQCPVQFECLGTECPHHFCMTQMPAHPLTQTALSLM